MSFKISGKERTTPQISHWISSWIELLKLERWKELLKTWETVYAIIELSSSVVAAIAILIVHDLSLSWEKGSASLGPISYVRALSADSVTLRYFLLISASAVAYAHYLLFLRSLLSCARVFALNRALCICLAWKNGRHKTAVGKSRTR